MIIEKFGNYRTGLSNLFPESQMSFKKKSDISLAKPN